MTLNFETAEELKNYLSDFDYEKKDIDMLEKGLEMMWVYLEKNELLRDFSKLDGHKAYCRLQNGYITISYMVKVMKIVEEYRKGNKYPDLEESEILLLVATSYNVFLEKIADFISIICDIEKLCKKKTNFYSASDIINQIENRLPNSQIFRYCDRRIRNAVAHYDFNIIDGKFVYYKNKHDYGKIENIVLDKELLIKGSLSLNRLAVFLFKQIEKQLKPYFDEERFSKDFYNFEVESNKLILDQKDKDSL